MIEVHVAHLGAAEDRFAGSVQYVGARPGNPVEDQEAQSRERFVALGKMSADELLELSQRNMEFREKNRRRTVEISERTDLRMAAPHREMASLSGGNIQRVILGRAFTADECKVLVAAYPSRGLDIATTRRTQELLLERRAAGLGVIEPL